MIDDPGWTAAEAVSKDPRERLDRPWWQGAVFYQIYPRSFLDTDGDGVGDLEGIRRRLPYLAALGVDALWLSPFYRSPMADFGYDVSDFCDVDPLFGDLDDAHRLVAQAHEHGLRVIVDFVPNHTSDQHPWFLDARSSRTARHRHWYIWRDGDPRRPPNNWAATFIKGPAWTWDEATGQWYLHQFLPQQPDLDWSNPEVVEAMHDVLRFWLDLGVDGFRIDVVHGLGKDPALPDDPPGRPGFPHSALNNDPRTHPIIRGMRAVADSYPGQRVLVGEVFLLDTALVAPYYGQGDELHLAFNFPPLFARWEADAWRACIDAVVSHIEGAGGWPTWVLSNHDNRRHLTRYGSADRARAAALLLLGLRGSPFVYAGEELGLSDAAVPPDRAVDPGGRDGCRAPIPWEAGPDHGWATADPWLPWPPEADTAHAAAQEADGGSFLHLYRRAFAARRHSHALRHGTFRWLPSPGGVLAWEREEATDRRAVVVNMTGDTVTFPGAWTLVLSSVAGEETWAGTVAPWAAVWLSPSS